MTKTKRVLAAVIAVITTVAMLSAFSVVSALTPQEIAQKESAELNKFIYNPFDSIANPGYGASVTASNLVFVDDGWKDAQDNTYVYLEYHIGNKKEIYRAIKGINAFASPQDAVAKVGRENLNIKVGAGTYDGTFGAAPGNFAYNGLTFYGNYAGTTPNVPDIEDPYIMNLNPNRNSELESKIAGRWTWEAGRYGITIDGFTVTEAMYTYVSSQYVGDVFIDNCIFNASFVMTSGGGYLDTYYFTNCRVVGATTACFTFGGANSDVHIENNYFENCSGGVLYVNAVGNKTGAPALVSFSNNLVRNCKNVVRYEYSNANYGINVAFNKVEGNTFYNCSGAYTVGSWYYVDAVSGTSIANIVDPTSKTYINKNNFINQPSGTPAIKLIGRESLAGKDVKFVISANYNKILFKDPKDPDNLAFDTSALGVVDGSYNYYNVASVDKIFAVDTLLSTMITMPYYKDEAMTELVAAGSIQWQTRVISKYYNPDPATYGINDKKSLIYAEALDGALNVTLDDKVLIAGTSKLDLYYDFMLTRPVANNVLPITGDRTLAYLVITNPTTGQSSKFGFTVNAKTDKTKAEYLGLYNKNTDLIYENTEVVGDTVKVQLDPIDINFPFYIASSPSSTVAYYTDADCKTAYKDEKYYMAPGKTTTIYAKITSGDQKTNKVIKLDFQRAGSAVADAAIESAVFPLDNINIFNNERKTIVYRPFAMVSKVAFDFNVSTGATYAIYSDKACTKLVSKQGDVKELPIGDGIVYYYVKVTNPSGFETVYTLVTYNDVKSTDNVIAGVTGITDGISIKDNVITIEASTTLALINAHFDTSPFADIVTYADANKKFKVDPSVTYQTVNNREVEVRTFQLGISQKVSYFYVDVTSEVGETNSYKVVIYKKAETTEFSDIAGHWGEKYIKDVADLGLVSGYAKGGKFEFRANNKATRQEVAILLCRMLGIEQHAFRNVALPYEDSSSIPEWSYNYVKAAFALEFMVGSNNKFNPTNNITRQEFFQAIAGVLKLDKEAAKTVDLGKFKDAKDVANWAQAATKACIKAGIVEGADGKLNPKSNITRAEIATILSKCTTIRNDVRYAD